MGLLAVTVPDVIALVPCIRCGAPAGAGCVRGAVCPARRMAAETASWGAMAPRPMVAPALRAAWRWRAYRKR